MVEPPSVVAALAANASGYETRWKNTFSSGDSENVVVAQLADLAWHEHWTSEEFIAFMSTGQLQKSKGALVSLNGQALFNSGLGYWLAFHNNRDTIGRVAFLQQQYALANPNNRERL